MPQAPRMVSRVERRTLAPWLPLAVVAMLLLVPGADAATQTARSPIVLESTTTVEPPSAGSYPISVSPVGVPVSFTIDLLSPGGTAHFRFDGDLSASWEENDVHAGASFDVDLEMLPNSRSIGTIDLDLGFFVVPRFEINYDSLFHDPLSYWGATPGMNKYPATGIRSGTVSIPEGWPEIKLGDTFTPDPGTSSVFVIDDGISVGPFSRSDTLSYTASPYPNLVLSFEVIVKTTVSYDFDMTEVCVRYTPPDQEDLCWTVDTPVTCRQGSTPWTETVDVPCRSVNDLVVPFCPIKGRASANVTATTEARVTQVSLTYTGTLAPVPPINGAPAVNSVSWLSAQSFTMATGKDDAIYAVPVGLAPVDVRLKSGGTEVPEDGDVWENNTYTIEWSPIDGDLQSCCSDYALDIWYRDLTHTNTASADYAKLYNPDPATGSQTWDVGTISGFADNTRFALFLEFYCPLAEPVPLYRTRSFTFYYQK